MRSEFSSVASTGWIPKNQTQSTPVRHQSSQLHQSNSHHILPPSSPLLTPRARTASTTNKASSFAASVRSVFHRSPHRATSEASLRSAYSANSSVKPPSYSSNADSSHLHPYASMVAAPLPVVSSHDASDEEEECPVCLEPLSSSFRLPGEKPHIVPECGHSLHEVSSLLPRFLLPRSSCSSLPSHLLRFPIPPYRRGSLALSNAARRRASFRTSKRASTIFGSDAYIASDALLSYALQYHGVWYTVCREPSVGRAVFISAGSSLVGFEAHLADEAKPSLLFDYSLPCISRVPFI
ncbi:hypothetical protein C8T65DRAFT_195870 [Cerioporus squamosus]|nr:hypothetical protein C8T65DRAFT_195870 [Cerioporus squamosus]